MILKLFPQQFWQIRVTYIVNFVITGPHIIENDIFNIITSIGLIDFGWNCKCFNWNITWKAEYKSSNPRLNRKPTWFWQFSICLEVPGLVGSVFENDVCFIVLVVSESNKDYITTIDPYLVSSNNLVRI